MVVLQTLGAAERRRTGARRRRAKPAATGGAEQPAPVPTARATIVDAEPFASQQAADEWFERVSSDEETRDGELAKALRELNHVLRAHRAAAADPYARDVARTTANVTRIGVGSGDQVADGKFAAALEVPAPAGERKRSVALQPQERLAALLAGSRELLVGEELLLRAHADLEGGRPREAALQARIALEALVAELADERRGALEAQREAVAGAANAALAGGVSDAQLEALAAAVELMRRELLRAAR